MSTTDYTDYAEERDRPTREEQEGDAWEYWYGRTIKLEAVNADMLAALEDIANGRLNATDAMLASRETLMSGLATYCQDRARAAIAKASLSSTK